MSTVRLLTLNTWGLKYVSTSRLPRLQAIADRLALDHDLYDVVALQEIWCQEDWDYIVQQCSAHFPYLRKFSSGIISGPGLAILSKFPIESTFLYRFPINGRPSAFWRGDWYVGKSVSVTLLQSLTEESHPLAILNSHMHAPYALEGDAAYECHRACQAWDFAQLANLLSKAGYAVVIVGDLNSRPGSLPHTFLTQETTFVDSWEQINGVQSLDSIANLSPELQIEIGGCTCDSILNTWRAKRQPDEACRLDYALIDASKLRTIEAQVRFTEVIPGVGSYSDHFAYACTLEISKKDTYRQLQRRNSLTVDKERYYSEMIQLLDTYNRTALWQQKWRIWHFFISIILIIGFAIATPFTSAVAGWSSVFWVLAAAVVGITGVVNGLIGYLYGQNEIRALHEVKMEVYDAMKHNKVVRGRAGST